jgi:hypothetical protein
MDTFDIFISDQYWIDGSREPEGCPEDTTSHGKIKLVINGTDISGCENEDTDYGLNQSAVRLLQTIFVNNASQNFNNPIFYHGCSVLVTCPNCIINFRVRHKKDGRVSLDRFYVTGGADHLDPKRYHKKKIVISKLEYAQKIVQFSEEALSFLPQTKQGEPYYEIDAYKKLRGELKDLIDLAKGYLQTKVVSSDMKRRVLGFSVPRPID